MAISRPRARARTLEPEALRQVERHEGGAFGERFERPWGKQWAEGSQVSVNLHWWPRRSALQVGDFEAAGRNKQQTTTTIFFLLTLDIFRELYLGGRRGVRHICSEPLGKGRHRAGSFREFSRARRRRLLGKLLRKSSSLDWSLRNGEDATP